MPSAYEETMKQWIDSLAKAGEAIAKGMAHMNRSRVMGDLLRAVTAGYEGDADAAKEALDSGVKRFNALTQEEQDQVYATARAIVRLRLASRPVGEGHKPPPHGLSIDEVTGKLLFGVEEQRPQADNGD